MPDNGAMPFNWKYLKPRRVELDKTQADMARECGMPNAAKWSQYERGELKNPTLKTLEHMTRGLQCTINDLLTSPPRRAGKRRAKG
jgi:transcriptional regulator with XRE-family HTH domain